jgi:hypothetical protein
MYAELSHSQCDEVIGAVAGLARQCWRDARLAA